MKRAFPLLALLALGCPRSTQQDGVKASATPSEPPAVADAGDDGDDEPNATTPDELRHRVVFADRTSQGYLLLVDEGRASMPTREGLQKLATTQLGAPEKDPEVKLLVDLIGTEPLKEDPKLAGKPNDGSPRETTDLLGLYIDVVSLRGDEGELVSVEQLTDPILTRDLKDEDRASLPKRNKAILLRVDYRNRYGVRGLRMLQTLVRLVAKDRGALIFDPDTGETVRIETFAKRRLQSSLSNIADQVAVVPFPDPRHGKGFVRLSTRGMRRFASVDVEMDGLPRDPAALQRATHLLYGLAYRLVRLGEFDASGYAVELPQEVIVERDDIVQAYQRREDNVPQCAECPGAVALHLVERAPEAHDPTGHIVARVVAPREVSDKPGYEQPGWAAKAISDVFGE